MYFLLKMVIFHCYISLPDGIFIFHFVFPICPRNLPQLTGHALVGGSDSCLFRVVRLSAKAGDTSQLRQRWMDGTFTTEILCFFSSRGLYNHCKDFVIKGGMSLSPRSGGNLCLFS